MAGATTKSICCAVGSLTSAFADLIADLGGCSAELEDATSAFRRLLEHE